jgi:hypothetical protein
MLRQEDGGYTDAAPRNPFDSGGIPTGKKKKKKGKGAAEGKAVAEGELFGS